jgi:hypothetical protein
MLTGSMETLPSDEDGGVLRFSSDNPSTAADEDFEHVASSDDHNNDDDTDDEDDPWYPHMISRTPSLEENPALPMSTGILILPSRTPSLQSNEAALLAHEEGPLLSLPGDSLPTDIDSLREALLGSLAGDSHHSETRRVSGGVRSRMVAMLVLGLLVAAVAATAAWMQERRTWRHANATLQHQVHELQADWRTLVARVSQDHEAQAAALQASLAAQVAAHTQQLEALFQEQDLKAIHEKEAKTILEKMAQDRKVQHEKDRKVQQEKERRAQVAQAEKDRKAEAKAKERHAQEKADKEARKSRPQSRIPYSTQETPRRAPTTSPYASPYASSRGGHTQKSSRKAQKEATFEHAWRQAESTLAKWSDVTQHTLRAFLDDFTYKAWKAHTLIFSHVDLTYHRVRLKFTQMWQAFNASLHEPQEETQFWQPIMLSATVVVAAAALTEGVSRWWSALVPPEECHAAAGCGHKR